MCFCSFGGSNPIFGETGHPYNAKYCPGGSSAGESSLIGAGGSLLGFGTDIGGSIRNPAHMCGITGLKPTMNRISRVGIVGNAWLNVYCRFKNQSGNN